MLVIELSVIVNAQAATITLLEENFNTENNGSSVLNYGSFTKFNVTDGTVDINGYSDFLPGN
ncbi:hypothetical protein [Trichormus azollae]|uniref:hypothetical protein n=1 Tax=Trichormus azollae TaxID=1164 RepID=UPI00325D259A